MFHELKGAEIARFTLLYVRMGKNSDLQCTMTTSGALLVMLPNFIVMQADVDKQDVVVYG